MKNTTSQALLCGTADALFVLLITFGSAAYYDGTSPLRLITEKWHILFTIIVPVSLMVGWRGGAHASRLISGNRSWFQPALEGFGWGFLFLPVCHAIGIMNEAFAAGPPWPSPGYSSAGDWLQYFWYLLQASATLGGVGALVGLCVSGINRLMLGMLILKRN